MIAIFIQARTGSTRLPNKSLKELPEGSGVTVLERVINRCKKCNSVDEIVVVTPDKPLVQIARKSGVLYSRYLSDRRDVLAEFYQAAMAYEADVIVRITGDCPTVDPKTIDKLVAEHVNNKWDVTYNRHDNLVCCSEIDGLDVEIFDYAVLEKAYKRAISDYDREHVTSFMYEYMSCVAVESGWHCETPEQIKLSVDTPEDYERMCKLYKALGSDFDTADVVKYLDKQNESLQHLQT